MTENTYIAESFTPDGVTYLVCFAVFESRTLGFVVRRIMIK